MPQGTQSRVVQHNQMQLIIQLEVNNFLFLNRTL